jgi:hypothetical protein
MFIAPGIVAEVLTAKVIATAEDISLPSTLLFTPEVIGPGYATKVPFIVLFALTERAP